MGNRTIVRSVGGFGNTVTGHPHPFILDSGRAITEGVRERDLAIMVHAVQRNPVGRWDRTKSTVTQLGVTFARRLSPVPGHRWPRRRCRIGVSEHADLCGSGSLVRRAAQAHHATFPASLMGEEVVVP